MLKLIHNKELFKESIQMWSLVMLVAGIGRLIAPYVREKGGLSLIIGFSTSIMGLFLLVILYSIFHVISPIIKLHYPNFRSPIEEKTNHQGWKELLAPEFWVFMILSCSVFFVATEILTAALYIGTGK